MEISTSEYNLEGEERRIQKPTPWLFTQAHHGPRTARCTTTSNTALYTALYTAVQRAEADTLCSTAVSGLSKQCQPLICCRFTAHELARAQLGTTLARHKQRRYCLESFGAALPALGKPRPSLLFYSDQPSLGISPEDWDNFEIYIYLENNN